MRLMYQEKMYDYKTKAEAEKHKEEMMAKGWQVKDEYPQNGNWNGYIWTIEYHR